MPLFDRNPRPVSRPQLEFRDDRIFYIATEDRYATAQYLNSYRIPRVHLMIFATPHGGGASAVNVVARLLQKEREFRAKNEILDEDQFWVVLDTDHQIQGHHKSTFVRALNQARRAGYRIAISNPCFELWLLLHHLSIAKGRAFAGCDEVVTELRAALGAYDKTKLRPEHFSGKHQTAVTNARALESHPDNPRGYWPDPSGSRVYLLIQQLIR